VQIANRKRREELGIAGLILLGALPLAAQERPNLEGVWKLAQPQTALSRADRQPVPFTEKGRARYEQSKLAAEKGDYSFDATMSRCSSPGLPRLMLTPDRFRIFQRPQVIAMAFEWNRLFRQIDLRSGTHERPLIGTMKGVTYGTWEGSTLVARSYGFLDKTLLDDRIPHSEQLELVERIGLRDRNTLEDRITITDPEMFTQPWEVMLSYKRQPDDTFPFAEDVCLDRKNAGQPPLPR
jgi:hypothetical protein